MSTTTLTKQQQQVKDTVHNNITTGAYNDIMNVINNNFSDEAIDSLFNDPDSVECIEGLEKDYPQIIDEYLIIELNNR